MNDNTTPPSPDNKIPDHKIPDTVPPPNWWQRFKARWSWRRFLIESVLVVVIFVGVNWYQTRNLIPEGEQAPALSLPVFDAARDSNTAPARWSLQAPTTRKRLLYFWAPWCGVCNQMTDTISTLHSDLSEDVEVVSVACSYKNLQEIQNYIAEHGVTYPVLLADDSVAARFHVSAFPTFYIVSEDGEVLSRFMGFTTSWGLRLRLM